MKESVNIWEYKVGINAIIANFVCMWKSRFEDRRLLESESNVTVLMGMMNYLWMGVNLYAKTKAEDY